MNLRLVGGSQCKDTGERRRVSDRRDDEYALNRAAFLAVRQSLLQVLGMSELSDASWRGAAVQQPPSLLRPAIVIDLDRWENDRRRQNKRGIKADRLRLDAIVKACGWKSIEEATPDSFLHHLAAQSAAGWKGSTANKTQTLLSTLLADVARRDPSRCIVNWAKGLPRASTDDSDDGSRPLAWSEYTEFLAWIKRHRPIRHPHYMTLGYTGIRRMEAIKLSVEQIRVDGNPKISLGKETKSKRGRVIPIADELLPTMRTLIENKKSGRVFERFPSYRTLARDLEDAGIADRDRIGFHSFRKCFAGRCAMMGIPLAVTQKMLGHSDPKLTANIYTQFSDGDLAQHIARLGGGDKNKIIESLTLPLAKSDAFGRVISPDQKAESPMQASPPQLDEAGRAVNGLSADDLAIKARPASPRSAGGKATSGIRTPDLCFTKDMAGANPGDAEALAKLFESIALVIRTRSVAPLQRGGVA